MTNYSETIPVTAEFRKESMVREIWRRFRKNKSAVLGLIILSIIIIATLAAPLYADISVVTKMKMADRFQPPSAEMPLGTDSFGRDELARILYGGRTSLIIGFGSALGALLLGGFFGLLVGYIGGTFDNVFMRFVDVMASIPTILLALAIVSSLGPSLQNLLIAITISRVPAFIRVIRASVLNIADLEYVEAAVAGGARGLRVIKKHILPNVFGTIVVQTTMSAALMLLQAAALSFLGLGIQPPNPEWGYMLSEAREVMRQQPQLMLYPGICIMLTTLSLSLVGDGLRDAFDPRLRN